MKVLVLLATVVAASHAITYTLPMLQEWARFKINHNKQYENELEENLRMKIFFDNKRSIEEHNARYEQGLITFTVGVNQFTDWSLEEFTQKVLSFNTTDLLVFDDQNQNEDSMDMVESELSLGDSCDWRTKGAVTPVQDQGDCESAYAFSAVSTLESAVFLKKKKLIPLSAQQLVSCSQMYGENDKCKGGFVNFAFEYVKDFGLESEANYKYTGKSDVCKSDTSKFDVHIKEFKVNKAGNEADLKKMIADKGPMASNIDASHDSFKSYKGGVYYEENCTSKGVSRSVAIVGFGTTEEGKDYWLLKNSLGTSWGEEGYMKLARNKDNHCGIANMAILTVLK